MKSQKITRELQSQTLKRAFEAAPLGIVIADAEQEDTPIVYTNRYFEEMTGYESDEVLGRNCRFLQGERTQSEPVRRLREGIAAGEEVTVELRNYQKTGEQFWNRVSIAPITDDDGTVTNFIGFQRDVTERKKREQQLDERNTVLRTVLEALPDGVLVEDAARDVLAVNSELCEILSIPASPTELEGRDCEAAAQELKGLFVEPEQFIDRITKILQRREPVSGEELELRDGRVLERDYVPYTLPDGNANLWLYRDVTERKEQQRELKRQNDQLERFASTVSHDLRNPLKIARSNLEMASHEHESELLDDVAAAHERMDDLIENLLTMARQGQSLDQVEEVALASVATDAWDNVATETATLETVPGTSEDVSVIEADRDRLLQLFENVFRNAIEHGPADVTVRVESLSDGFAVADTGPGIPENERETVLEYGYTTTESGTGFGLAIVNEIAQAHGWTTTVTESRGGGARFEFQTCGR